GSESTSAGPQGPGARRRLSLRVVLIVVVAVGVLLLIVDQITKHWAEANLPLLQPQPFLGEILQLTLLYNSGAAWGMGSGIKPVRSTWYAIALALVIGVALGHIHDRLPRPPGPFRGEVVDFLQLPNWPVFNVADMAVVGVAILVILLGLIGVPADPAVAEAVAAEKAEATKSGVAGPEEQTSSPTTSSPPSPGGPDGGEPGRGRGGSEPRL